MLMVKNVRLCPWFIQSILTLRGILSVIRTKYQEMDQSGMYACIYTLCQLYKTKEVKDEKTYKEFDRVLLRRKQN